jgi:diguanylate cyclase
VILFILSIAIMNLGLGYALAVVLSDAPLALPELIERIRAAALAPEPEPVPELPAPVVDDLPLPWQEQLQEAQLIPGTFFEGLLLKLWIEIAPLREQLLTAEVRGRLAQSRLDQAAELQLLADVHTLQVGFAEHLQHVYTILQQFYALLDEPEAFKEELEEELERRIAFAERCGQELASIDVAKEPDLGGRQLLSTLAQWIEQVHEHRDCVQSFLATKFREGSELNGPGQPLYLDPLTGQISRFGIENLLSLWWQEDPQRLRLVSCALVDVDRFDRFNERLGHRAGDRLLHAISNLLQEGIRTDRGFDRLARMSGQQFFVFFGDTGPKNAGIAVERIRQNIEATTLDYEGNEFDFTISVGIVAIRRDDTPETLFARLREALQTAKKHGRNRTSIDDGEGAQTLFEPKRFPVKAQLVRIEPE